MSADDPDAQVMKRALMKIVRACEGGTPIGDRNWETEIKRLATLALEEIGIDWKRELQFPEVRGS